MDATVGFLSVKTHPRESCVARVRVDGVDVTRRCYAADDQAGYADCFRHNADGRPYLEGGQVAKERLTGQVVIDFPHGLD